MSDEDFLEAEEANLEQRFQDLEREAEIESMRRNLGGSPRRAPADPPAQNERTTATAQSDPLESMKDALDDEKELERYVLCICPHCDAKNRVSLTRLRGGDPKCGACKQPLSFVKV
jgi:hypothetical protein